MSSIGPKIPNAGDGLRIGGEKLQDTKKTEKQSSTSGVAIKALDLFKSGMAKINLNKHLGNLEQLSHGLNKLSMSLFTKLFAKSKKATPDLILFDDSASFRKKDFSQALDNLVKSRSKSESSINLMDQDIKHGLSDLQEKVQEHDSATSALYQFVDASAKGPDFEVRSMELANQKLNEHLSQIGLQRKLSSSSSTSSKEEVVLPQIKLASQKSELSAPLSPKFQISPKSSFSAPSSVDLKEAASKLKLGSDFKTEHREFVQKTKRQLDENQEQANQVKKQLSGTQAMVQEARKKGVIDEKSAKELDKNLNFFGQVNQKIISTLDRAKGRLDQWRIPAGQYRAEDPENRLDAENENFIDNLLGDANEGAVDIAPKGK